MSAHTATLSATEDTPVVKGERLKTLSRLLLPIGGGMLLLTLAGGFFSPKQAAFSYLWAIGCFYAILAGALFWTLLHHATNGGWGVLVRRQAENIASCWPILALLIIPLLLPDIRHLLWKWTKPGMYEADVVLQAKSAYLNDVFWYIRMAFYLTFFTLCARYFRNCSMEQDRDGNPIHSLTMQKRSYVMIPLFAISVTFTAIDWYMALDHHWFSTMFGVWFFAGTAGSSMAALILSILFLKSQGYLEKVNEEHFHIMGKLLFAFTVFWAYISFCQYMLIWYANIPEETGFFIKRSEGTWFYVSFLLVIGRFVIPFFMLISQESKKNPWRLGISAGWILTWHMVDHYWVVMPQYHGNWSPHILDVTAWLGVACVIVSFYLKAVSNSNLYPLRDPRLPESVGLKN
jgi:hypothetical protein